MQAPEGAREDGQEHGQARPQALRGGPATWRPKGQKCWSRPHSGGSGGAVPGMAGRVKALKAMPGTAEMTPRDGKDQEVTGETAP